MWTIRGHSCSEKLSPVVLVVFSLSAAITFLHESFGRLEKNAYLCGMNRSKRRKDKFANWLLDIAKYITTAVIISSIFEGFEDRLYLLIVGVAVVGASLGWGLLLTQDDEPRNKKKKGE